MVTWERMCKQTPDREVTTRERTGSNKERSMAVRDIERTQCHTQSSGEDRERAWQNRVDHALKS